MNLTLFLIILIALIIIFCIILYNGIRILLTVGKEKGIVKYEFKVTILKIPIFKRTDSKGILEIIKSKDQDDDSEKNEEEKGSKEDEDLKTKTEKSEEILEKRDGKSQEQTPESEDKEEDGIEEPVVEKDEKSLIEKYKEIKPILNELKKSKEELKGFLNKILKAIDLKKLEGNFIIGLSDHATTVKIASWIWSIGAIVNSKKPTLLTVEPRFTEIITDFEGKIELKINILLLIIYSLLLLTKKNIRELIKVIYKQYKSPSEEEEETNRAEEERTSENKETEENKPLEKEKLEDEPLEPAEPEEEEEPKAENLEEEEEEAVTQVKQLMKIIRSD